MTREVSIYPQLPPPSGAYSHVTAAGGIVFTAGFGPQNAEGSIPNGIEPQTRAALDNLEAALRAAGCGWEDVLKVTVHLADLDRDFVGFDATYRSILPEPFPVRTTVGSALGNILIEIDAVAASGS